MIRRNIHRVEHPRYLQLTSLGLEAPTLQRHYMGANSHTIPRTSLTALTHRTTLQPSHSYIERGSSNGQEE
jgi:hypothetical protein